MKLRAEHLIKKYGARTVVKDVTIQLEQGEIIGLLGPNGAGKTTTFYMTVGFVSPFSGNVFLDGTNITKLPMYKRAQLGIGYLPQESSIFRKLSVEDNIRAVLEMTALNKKKQTEKNFKTFAKTCEIPAIFRKIFEIVRMHPNASERIRMHPNASERIRTHPNVSKNIKNF